MVVGYPRNGVFFAPAGGQPEFIFNGHGGSGSDPATSPQFFLAPRKRSRRSSFPYPLSPARAEAKRYRRGPLGLGTMVEISLQVRWPDIIVWPLPGPNQLQYETARARPLAGASTCRSMAFLHLASSFFKQYWPFSG